MKRVLNFVKGAFGLVALTAFVLVLVGLFGPLNQKAPMEQQEHPAGTVTSTVSLPPATATPEPYPPPPMPLPNTPTSGPYPPPQPTVVFPTITPTFTPRPPVAPGPITSKLEIIWAESTRITTAVGPNQPGFITFWRASIADLTNGTNLITMPEGYSLANAGLSPDGSKIILTTWPPPPSKQRSGILWVMNFDGSGLRELARDIEPGGWLGNDAPTWSPDSQTVAYLKLVSKELLTAKPQDSTSNPFIYELYSVSVDDADSKLLLSDELGYDPLGWSSDGGLFYYLRSSQEGRELWAVESVGDGESQSRALLGVEIRSARLSPDGAKLVFNTPGGLVLLSTDGGKREVISPLFGGIWSPDSTEIIGGGQRQIEALDVNTKEVRVLLTEQQLAVQRISGVDTLLSVSPDGRWLVFRNRDTGGLYLSEVQSNVRLNVPEPDALHSSYFVGWIPAE